MSILHLTSLRGKEKQRVSYAEMTELATPITPSTFCDRHHKVFGVLSGFSEPPNRLQTKASSEFQFLRVPSCRQFLYRMSPFEDCPVDNLIFGLVFFFIHAYTYVPSGRPPG
jgi:hypothetical protein